MAIKTYAASFMSRWQSAVLAAIRGDDDSTDADIDELGSSHPIMQASCDACEVMEAAMAEGRNPLDFATDVSKTELLTTCAQLYLGLAAAKISGNDERAKELETEIQYSVCDPLWAKTLLEFDSEDEIPYRHFESLDDFIVPLAPTINESPPERVKIAFVSDWATGTALAKNVMRCIAAERPDVVIHLGDVYYSGTKAEMNDHFLAITREHLPPETQVLNLAGNHDLYAGGEGYYWLIDELGQPASYFCLRNDHWQVLAVGAPPETKSPTASQNIVPSIDPLETQWHRHKIDTAEGRKTVMLSHYQLFSSSGNIARTPDNRPMSLNPVLFEAFGSHLDAIDVWLWGHEHNLAAFEPYAGLRKGRCIGSGAMPVGLLWEPYKPLDDQVTPDELGLIDGLTTLPVMSEDLRLGHDGDHYHHAFCVLDIDGADGEMTYFQVPGVEDDAEAIYTEQI